LFVDVVQAMDVNLPSSSSQEPYKVVDQMFDLIRFQSSSQALVASSSSAVGRVRDRSDSVMAGSMLVSIEILYQTVGQAPHKQLVIGLTL